MTLSPSSNVHGRSLAGANLASAALAGSDLRGTDFTGADLHDADLSHIRAGMSRRWSALIFVGSLVLSVAVGLLIGVCTRYLLAMYSGGDVRQRMAALFVVSALLVFIVAGIWRGLHYATSNVLPVTAALAVAAGLSAVVSGTGTGVVALLTVLFVGFAVVIVGFAVLVRAVAGTLGKVSFMIVAVSGALVAGVAGGGIIGTTVAVGAMLMARRSARLGGDYPLLTRWTTAIACRGGTRFRNADLHGANLEDARLVACDFRGANLEGAHIDRGHTKLCRFDSAGAAG